ncbi:hypothetical protein D3C71_1663950 [compost metagenome]
MAVANPGESYSLTKAFPGYQAEWSQNGAKCMDSIPIINLIELLVVPYRKSREITAKPRSKVLESARNVLKFSVLKAGALNN